MWAAGYFGRIPPPEGWLPPAGLMIALIAIQLLAGMMLARSTAAKPADAVLGGMGTALINLLILGSLLREDHTSTDVLMGAGGLLAMSAILALAGYGIGRLTWRHPVDSINWTGTIACVAATATFILVIAGGLVTGHEAGLAVVDWPNTQGRLMFLYPLSRMTGGVYYEHAHRLYGALVGLTTIALAFQIWRERSWRDRSLSLLALAAVVLVIVQGILGGLRVTGEFTLSADALQTRPNLALAIVHGVLAQIFFAIMVSLAAMTTTSWSIRRNTVAHPSAASDQGLSTGLVGILLLQLLLGALYRHLSGAQEISRGMIHGILGLHIVVAALVLAWALLQGIRQCTVYRAQPIIRRLGFLQLIAVNLQVMLGVIALITVFSRNPEQPIPSIEVIVTTMHQATGALLLAIAVLSAAWLRRVVVGGAAD